MVNGNYVLYGDKPSSESEIVDDHVHARTVDRKCKRKAYRSANELQLSLNMAQIDNETDSVKYEKKIKEPRLLRYVPTTEVEENFVTEKFETYDLKPTEQRPRRYTFAKKPKNSSDGSVNYAYSRSSSSCSSPNANNLPTISEHIEHYGTYRVRAIPSPNISDIMPAYESKLDKYFTKPREVKSFAAKGSHPDSLYRVSNDSTITSSKLTRIMRLLRWPVALVVVCIALAIFVYFLMPGNIEIDVDPANGTYWDAIAAGAESHRNPDKPRHKPPETNTKKENRSSHHHETKPTEMDFYDAENSKNDLPSVLDVVPETILNRKLPVPPVFPTHITPEVQYGNEKADTDKLRTPKKLGDTESLSEDSTLKPHITQKPEKPLEIYFNNGNVETTTSTESVNDFIKIVEEKHATNNNIELTSKIQPPVHKGYTLPTHVNRGNLYNAKEIYGPDVDIPPELQEYYARRPSGIDVNFTSGHSKLFGISIEDAEKMQSTTQSSLYNTRVSPTLPTWRDGDDSTTKKYPTNVNSEVPQCRSTRLALCRGVLPYDLAGSPAIIKGVEITTLLSQIEYLLATNCSDRVRHFACALLEPECNPPPYPPKIPCYNLCKAVLDSCDGLIPRELTPAFKCNQYSRTNCVAPKSPCYPREKACGDGLCIPRDWICDGTQDCPGGEDEASCLQCDKHEYRCRSGGCILKRWLCDGYADCPAGEDEDDQSCAAKGRSLTGVQVAELGEESAGSAPAPVVRRPSRLPTQSRQGQPYGGENDSSKELLMTSDSGNPYKRNFTRRPSPSRLVPYTRQVPEPPNSKEFSTAKDELMREFPPSSENTTLSNVGDSKEEVNIEDMGFFDDLKKTPKEMLTKSVPVKTPNLTKVNLGNSNATQSTTRLDKSINKLEKVIDGAAMLKEAVAENAPNNKDEEYDSPETNVTSTKKHGDQEISISAHVSPCPSGELRCVDGRCITLAQLCDGTIDCSDHADEDNCYT
ncbi:hypothetical protein K1T71_001752 [Dendrolimus kikuchii]|uniref:Uncharacterized protein n=1 Tax=Dendrolimus kikuchii TaxID=765133 RepID=A0ACC1DFF9_9NEOP|nr:hypothetical protein K1T71_001752 [Dendrolimus kikuchii]